MILRRAWARCVIKRKRAARQLQASTDCQGPAVRLTAPTWLDHVCACPAAEVIAVPSASMWTSSPWLMGATSPRSSFRSMYPERIWRNLASRGWEKPEVLMLKLFSDHSFHSSRFGIVEIDRDPRSIAASGVSIATRGCPWCGKSDVGLTARIKKCPSSYVPPAESNIRKVRRRRHAASFARTKDNSCRGQAKDGPRRKSWLAIILTFFERSHQDCSGSARCRGLQLANALY